MFDNSGARSCISCKLTSLLDEQVRLQLVVWTSGMPKGLMGSFFVNSDFSEVSSEALFWCRCWAWSCSALIFTVFL